MRFLTTEKDLILNSLEILCFYSSDDPASNIIFDVLSKMQKDIICIDLSFFKNLHKRFDIDGTPTILIMKQGIEFKRILGVPSINDINNILDED